MDALYHTRAATGRQRHKKTSGKFGAYMENILVREWGCVCGADVLTACKIHAKATQSLNYVFLLTENDGMMTEAESQEARSKRTRFR